MPSYFFYKYLVWNLAIVISVFSIPVFQGFAVGQKSTSLNVSGISQSFSSAFCSYQLVWI